MREAGFARRQEIGVQVVRTRPRSSRGGVVTSSGPGADVEIPVSVALTSGKVPLPTDVTAMISQDAAARVRAAAPRSPGGGIHGASLIRATWRQNEVGVHIPREAIHLFYLDKGIQPRIMWELQGKTIPIRLPGGQIIFRKATNVGQQVPLRDETGQVVGYKIAWRHPGVPPMNFIEPNIQAAIRAWWSRQSPQAVLELVRRYYQATGTPSARGVRER